MIFKEVEKKDGSKKYFMGNSKDTIREVSKDVYNKLIEDDMFRTDNLANCGDGDFCEVCQGILDFINDLANMEPEDAIESFENVIFENREESFMEGVVCAYRCIGDTLHQVANELES